LTEAEHEAICAREDTEAEAAVALRAAVGAGRRGERSDRWDIGPEEFWSEDQVLDYNDRWTEDVKAGRRPITCAEYDRWWGPR
jgi:hypothetical protein